MLAFFHLARLSRLSVCLRHLVFIEGESPLKLPLSACGLLRDRTSFQEGDVHVARDRKISQHQAKAQKQVIFPVKT